MTGAVGRKLGATAIALAVALAAAGVGAMPDTAQAKPPLPVDLELVLAVDVSGSIDDEEAALQRKGYVGALQHPEVIAAVRSGMLRRIAVTYFEWAGNGWQQNVMGWHLIEDRLSSRAFAAALAASPIGTGPWTSISSAIDYAVPLFAANRFEGTRRVIDMSGDGPNNMGRLAPAARDEAVARGIIINGLPIMNDRPNISRFPMPNLDLYYRNCVIGGPGAFIVIANDFKDFARAIRRKLVLEIAGRSGADGPLAPGAGRTAQAADGIPPVPGRGWVPPCDEGERRFRGIIWDE